MKIPATHLDAFLAVTRHGRFAKAAEALGLSQSALSQRVLNLESLLEATLFVRDRAATRLTPEGEALLRHARTLENLEEEFLERRTGGALRVAGFSSVARSLLLPALAPLAREPAVRLTLLSRELHELHGLLRRGEADLVAVDAEPAREGIAGELLGFEENVLVRCRDARRRADIYLDHDMEDATTHRYFQKFGPKGARLERAFLDDVYGLLDGARLGLGQAVLPLHLVEGDRDLEIVHPERVLKTPVWLHYTALEWEPKLRARAREEIVKYAKEKLASR
jgi:DNA-binding transcriptional LysR family regulator